jgi:hypothetical protein
MKSFTRIKVINGQEYLYEITPYYDKEKKQIRQKKQVPWQEPKRRPRQGSFQGSNPKESTLAWRIHTH